MNKKVNNFLLARDKFILEMHLWQFGFAYSSCGPFTKHEERIKKFKKQGIQATVIKTNYRKLVFDMIMGYGDFKYRNRRTAANNVLRDKTFDIAKDSKYDGYQCVLASMVYKFFDEKNFW